MSMPYLPMLRNVYAVFTYAP